ncbi:MAG: hypothetical protein IT579_01355 [Verrucomicrobia subdivision 3 bacterium]|nr:hypothetical protein [Limisphaerales bacterium]
MTKLIAALMVLGVVFVGYLVFQQWDKARTEHDNQRRIEAAANVSPESLPGMPSQLDQSFRAAKENGPAAYRAWFNTYERQLADPRKAWIELELCVALARENPAEAKRIFAGVKGRLPPASPVWPKMKELEKTFE